jgi:hypothetical protein
MIKGSSKAGFSKAGRLAAIGLGVAVAIATPLSASARGHGYHHGGGHYEGYRSGYHGDHYRRGGGHWNGGRWIAGAIVTGAVIGLVSDALRPAPVYYDRPVVYSRPRRVVYSEAPPVITRRVVETRTIEYQDPYQTRYIRNDRYDRDDGYDRDDD